MELEFLEPAVGSGESKADALCGMQGLATWWGGGGVPDGNRGSLGSQSRPGRKGQQLLLAEVGRVNSVKVEGLTVML